MVRSIANNISYLLLYQTIVVASETKVLRSTAGWGAGYPVPLELGFMNGVSNSSSVGAVGLQPFRFIVLMLANNICYTPMYQAIVVAAETKVLRSTAGWGAYYPLPFELGFMNGCQ